MWASMLKIQIQRDMIMLENQIPLFILDQLLSLQLGKPDQNSHVAKLALKFFNPKTQNHMKPAKSKPSSFRCGLHCLEMLRRSFQPERLPRRSTKGWSQDQPQLVPCLTKLREAGIKFSISYSDRLGDIDFKDGILTIPKLNIHEGTRSLFLNLIAFEQSHFDCNNIITSYVIFMHNLINSPEDVRYLCNCRIIMHCLGSEAEVVDLFNQLRQEVAFHNQGSYLNPVSFSVNCHCSLGWFDRGVALVRKWNAWRAILKNKYFDNPWSIISFVTAFVLLVLTFIQAFYAVYSYYKPRS